MEMLTLQQNKMSLVAKKQQLYFGDPKVVGHKMTRPAAETNKEFKFRNTHPKSQRNSGLFSKGSRMVSVCKCLWVLEKIKVSQLFFNVQFTLSGLSIL